jgi:hypothetical protein
MGNLRGDLKAVNVVVPAGDFNHGDLYRINTFSGFLINDCLTAAVDRNRAMEIAMNRMWEVKLPGALAPAVGDLLYWTAGAGTKRGDTDLAAAVVGPPIVKVVKAKNANGYASVVLCGTQ